MTTSNLMKYKKHLSAVMTFNYWIFFLISALLTGCSSSNDDNEEQVKNNLTIDISDIKGTWYVTKSTSQNWDGIVLVLNDRQSCSWTHRDGEYVGPYYFLENVNDKTLKEQCGLLGIEPTSANRIHIGKINISEFATEESNYQEVYRSQLNITCDLRPYLPSKNSQVFIDNKVDHDAWYFWVDSDFSYKFEITAYTNNSMKLKLVESDFRFADYEEKYPLRTSVGTELTLERSIRE